MHSADEDRETWPDRPDAHALAHAETVLAIVQQVRDRRAASCPTAARGLRRDPRAPRPPARPDAGPRITWSDDESPTMPYGRTGEACQISSAYSRIARSDENLPTRATLSTARRVHRSGSW